MRLLKGLVIGLTAAGLAGCSGPKAESMLAVGTPGPAVVVTTAQAAPPASPKMKSGAGAAAARFYGLYSASQFAALWDLLSPAMKRQVSQGVWVGVHEACPGAAAGKSRTIKAVTVFGTAAIITEAVGGATASPSTAEDVFSYADAQWSYSPGEVSIYLHGSIAADVAAAKTAGFCSSWKVF